MILGRAVAMLCFCFSISALHAQNETGNKQGTFSFGISLSDYNAFGPSKDSALHTGTTQRGLFKPGNGSFGMQVSYWKHVLPHIDFSGNFGTVFSNFPAGFVKGDSIGQAAVSVHADALVHLKAFAGSSRINPFLTAGAGGGYFGKQFALYAPLGGGVVFRFNAGSILILQMQMRDALSQGITGNFMYYSASLAHDIPGNRLKKSKSTKSEAVISALPPVNTTTSADVAKASDNKPVEKDTIKILHHIADTGMLKSNSNQTAQDTMKSSFPEVEGATIVAMSRDSVTYRIHFDFDHSELVGESYGVLNRIVKILQADKTLTIHISGYADNQGTKSKNMQVSADRAKVTYDYFMSYDIAPSRITSSYYGSSHPVDTVQQWLNRRVEITILKH